MTRTSATSSLFRPRLGFLGTGWIGKRRLEAIARGEVGQIVAIADPSPRAAEESLSFAPGAKLCKGLANLLEIGVDGVVIATPTGFHEEQALDALRAGVAVFCQAPLGRTAHEARAVVEMARQRDLLLGVDFSYRFAEAMANARAAVQAGELGSVFAADLTFHEAQAPDRTWYRDRALSGGGCLMNLGVHLLDLALWILASPQVERTRGSLFAKGRPLADRRSETEDWAAVTLALEGACEVRLACSWNLPLGRDRAFEASFYGTEGGFTVKTLKASFDELVAERLRGPTRERLASPAKPWDGCAALEWARQLAAGKRYDAEIESAVRVAEVLDRIYTA
jgi:predicted dehydrogenase